MQILITGSTGLIGSRLASHLTQKGHRVLHMVRRTPRGSDEIQWDIKAGTLDKAPLEGVDAVVHLAGESIASGRWNNDRKRGIRDSRILGTRLLATTLAGLFDPPKVLVSVSAVGYYGDRGDELLDENSGPGQGFLADLCREWEAETAPAAMRQIRVVIPRLAMVLSPKGGALDRMLPAFRRGLGGTLGSGRQYMSWIALDDLVGVLAHAIQCETLSGPVIAASPNPETNSVFTRSLADALGRRAPFFVPTFAARLVWGQMADEVLLSSARVNPQKLIDSGYRFQHPDLGNALKHILRPGREPK